MKFDYTGWSAMWERGHYYDYAYVVKLFYNDTYVTTWGVTTYPSERHCKRLIRKTHKNNASYEGGSYEF